MASALVNLIEGLPLKDPEAQLEIKFDDEYLIIEERSFKVFKTVIENTFKIPLCNILDTIVTTEKEVVDKDKSAIGRGVLGGAIFGPAGLILGGMSGIGTKKKKETIWVYIVSFVSSGGEIKNITFKMSFVMKSVTDKFDKTLKKKLDSIERSEEVKKILTKTDQKEFLL
ncbi:hypothetical protein Desde_1095 [Desulfitobacterium dehalogenans ATCC 51507]|uniref:Uncharacterized protein n=1 Tax=Desulfitobacterium dehalogenans (strain ATCC 51507 / DSM 9161 / JW/IU-DC1) TaxID=756499 RepID=I4A6E3_DESDJ|nr:hypothetical protein [Desulfitobacterium dehalogenans]AFL99527.1 hypothetical protein Desde_1095 [Desulfitobacterium dehalogenans ATCC 51507]